MIVTSLLVWSGCARELPSASLFVDASAAAVRTVRVPGALMVARALDTLSVGIDPSSGGMTQVTVDSGMFLGVRADALLFARGYAEPVAERHRIVSSLDFEAGAWAWNSKADGVPLPNTKYVVEVQLVVFETDVRPTPEWDPHTGAYKALWTQTLRQAEE